MSVAAWVATACCILAAAPPRAGSAGPPVQPMTAANRTSGIAPLSVFFDAVDTNTPDDPASPFIWSSGVHQPADHEGAQYSWDFGDPGAGTWPQTALPRNSATGYTAAHVFETPGVYAVTLTQTDVSGAVRVYRQTITVAAFSGTTYYVAQPPTGDDANEGRSATNPFATAKRAMTAALGTDGPVRVLFRRGDTFTVADRWDITKPGPGIVGAYGTGDRPVFEVTFEDGNGTNVFSPHGAGVDWRFMDLDMRAAVHGGTNGPIGPTVMAQGVNTLILRVRAQDFYYGIGWGNWKPIYQTPHDGMFVVDSESTCPKGFIGSYVGGRRLALLGNAIHDIGVEHVLRVWQAHKAVISNNTLARPGGVGRHALKLHGPEMRSASEPETRWVSISDNVLIASATSQWTSSIGSQSAAPTEASAMSHIVYERNRHVASPSTVASLQASVGFMMVRNNLFETTACRNCDGILFHRRGTTEPAPTNVRILHNTIYKGSASSEAAGINVTGAVVNAQVRNNLFGVSSTSGNTMILGRGGTGWVADHNVLTTAPRFVKPALGDFSLASGSPALRSGAPLPEVREDFRRRRRPAAAPSVGAFEAD